MQLSEAIRLGAMLKPQGFGSHKSSERVPGTSCALDAVAECLGLDMSAATVYDEPAHYAEIQRRFPFIADAKCPACAFISGETPARVVWHLNDYHKWTREQIADWVETIERAQSPAAGEPQAVETSPVSVGVVAGS